MMLYICLSFFPNTVWSSASSASYIISDTLDTANLLLAQLLFVCLYVLCVFVVVARRRDDVGDGVVFVVVARRWC